MKLFEISFSAVLLRYYLMMGIVIGSLFSPFPAIALLALPIFLSAMLGLSFGKKEEERQENKAQNLKVLKNRPQVAA